MLDQSNIVECTGDSVAVAAGQLETGDADPNRRESIQRTCFGPPCTSVILLNVKEEYDRNSGKNGIPELVTSTIRAGCSARAEEGNSSVRITSVSHADRMRFHFEEAVPNSASSERCVLQGFIIRLWRL